MSLTNIEKTIELDVYDHDTTPSVIKTIQMDTGTRTVFAVIQNSRQDYDIGQNATVSLTVLRPDKTKVQVTGQTFVCYTGTDGTMYGAKAELSDVALAVKGNLKAQFKITSGEQELRTEIFTISNGEALDADDGDWAGDLDGHNLDEMAESIETLQTDMTTVNNDVSELKEDIRQGETFVGVHRSSPGIPNQRVPFYIPKNTLITIYTIDGEPFADSSTGQIQFFNSDQSVMTTYATIKPAHGNARTVIYDGDVDAEYFSVIPITQATNVAVVWYENDGIKEEKENLLTSLSDVGIEAINLFNTRRFWTNNTAVTNNNDGTYTVGTSDYGRTTFGDEVYLEKGQYLLFATPSVGYSYLCPSNNINTIIVANYTTTSQIITLKESVTAKLCFRVSSAPSESFVIRPFLYKKTNAVDLYKYSAVYSLKGTPILFPPSKPYKYTGESITERFLTGTGNLLEPLYSLYDALESEYSNFMTKEVIGHDQSGTYEMRCYTIQQYDGAPNRPTILWISGIHASEPYTHTSTYMLVKELLENHDSDDVLGFIWRNCTLKVIPIANPWGLANGASRYNSRGVNLNRNFPCDWVFDDSEYDNSGSAPASEAETQNIINFIKANPNALFAVNRHDSGTLTSEGGRMAYVVDSYKTDVNVLRAFFATMQNALPTDYPWIVQGRPSSAYNLIFSTLSSDTTPGMMDKWFNMYGTHGCLLEISRPATTGYTANKQQDFLKINMEIVINMLASVLMQNQLVTSSDELWKKYPVPQRN